jgi:ACDE family multidrug resistance protein
MFHRILAAVDSTERSTPVLAATTRLAQIFGAGIHVLHVDPAAAAFDSSGDAEDDAAARTLVETAVARLTAAGIAASGEVIHAVDGDIARTIVRVATSAGADLVILGPHHRRGLAAWLDGSVSDDVLHLRTTIPVLVLP